MAKKTKATIGLGDKTSPAIIRVKLERRSAKEKEVPKKTFQVIDKKRNPIGSPFKAVNIVAAKILKIVPIGGMVKEVG